MRESVASLLVKRQRIRVRIDALDRNLDAVVDEIVPTADPGSRSFVVKVTLADAAGLYPGMFGRLLIPTGETETIYIPAAAVTQVGQLDFVTVSTDQGPARRYVRVGERRPDGRVSVISGLAPGETLVVPEG